MSKSSNVIITVPDYYCFKKESNIYVTIPLYTSEIVFFSIPSDQSICRDSDYQNLFHIILSLNKLYSCVCKNKRKSLYYGFQIYEIISKVATCHLCAYA